MEKDYTKREPIEKNSGKTVSKIVIICLALCLAAGAAVGAAAAVGLKQAEYSRLSSSLIVHINTLSSQTAEKLDIFAECLVKYGKTLVIIWFLAFFPPGTFAAPLLILAKGISLGFSAALMLKLFDGDGLWYSALLFAPQNLLVLPAYCCTAFFSVKCSVSYFRAKLIKNKAAKSREESGEKRGKKGFESRLGTADYLPPLIAGMICVIAASLWETFLTAKLWMYA